MSLDVKKLLTQPLVDSAKEHIAKLFRQQPVEVVSELYQIPKADALSDVANELLLQFFDDDTLLCLFEDKVAEHANAPLLLDAAQKDLHDLSASKSKRNVAAYLIASILDDFDYASSLCDLLLKVESHLEIAVELVKCVDYTLIRIGQELLDDEICKKFIKANVHILNKCSSSSSKQQQGGSSSNEEDLCVQALLSLRMLVARSSEKAVAKFLPLVQKELKHEKENVRIAALKCIANVYAKHYEAFIKTVKPTIQTIAPLIKSVNDEEASFAIEVITSIVEIEQEIGIPARDSSIVREEATVMPLLLGALTGSFDNNSLQKFEERSKQAGTCLNFIAQLVQDDILKYLTPFIKENINNAESVAKRDAACMCLAIVFGGGPSLLKHRAFINEYLPVLLAVVNDKEPEIKDTKYFALSNLIKNHTSAIVKQSSEEILQVLEQGLSDPNPKVYSMCCCAISAAAEEEGFPVNSGNWFTVLSSALVNKIQQVTEYQDVLCQCLDVFLSRAEDKDSAQVKKIWDTMLKLVKSDPEKNVPKLPLFLSSALLEKLQAEDLIADLTDYLILFNKALESKECDTSMLLTSIAGILRVAPEAFEKAELGLKPFIAKLIAIIKSPEANSMETIQIAIGLFETIIQSCEKEEFIRGRANELIAMNLDILSNEEAYDLACKAAALNVVSAYIMALKGECKPFAKLIVAGISKAMKIEDFRGIHDEPEYLEAHTAICTCMSMLVDLVLEKSELEPAIVEIIGNELKLSAHEDILAREDELEAYYKEICFVVRAVYEKFGKTSVKQLATAVQKFVKNATKFADDETKKLLPKLK